MAANPKKQRNILQRIEAHAANDWTDNDCWLSTYAAQRLGYVYIRPQNGTHGRVSQHRIAYEAFNAEPIPEGMVVMHTCDNPACFNPNHLTLGTQQDNMIDCVTKGRGRWSE